MMVLRIWIGRLEFTNYLYGATCQPVGDQPMGVCQLVRHNQCANQFNYCTGRFWTSGVGTALQLKPVTMIRICPSVRTLFLLTREAGRAMPMIFAFE